MAHACPCLLRTHPSLPVKLAMKETLLRNGTGKEGRTGLSEAPWRQRRLGEKGERKEKKRVLPRWPQHFSRILAMIHNLHIPLV